MRALLLILLLSGCAGPAVIVRCPALEEHPPEFAATLADQLERLPLPEYSALAEVASEWYVLRRQLRPCQP